MRVPQVSERLKEVPAQALRGVFAGIGQLLLITDKLRNKAPAGHDVPRARAPEPAAPAEVPVAAAAGPAAEPEDAAGPAAAAGPEPAPAAAGPEPAPAAAAQQRDLDKTGNVRLLGGPPQRPEAAAAAQAADEPGRAAPGPAPAPPLPNYDELTVASLRARLRNLSADQVRQLASYEKAHAARAEVITMFERRIAKLESGG